MCFLPSWNQSTQKATERQPGPWACTATQWPWLSLLLGGGFFPRSQIHANLSETWSDLLRHLAFIVKSTQLPEIQNVKHLPHSEGSLLQASPRTSSGTAFVLGQLSLGQGPQSRTNVGFLLVDYFLKTQSPKQVLQNALGQPMEPSLL